jgi:phosphoglycerol transferase MdoB-like AlkP superfamily enzyme
MALHPPIFQESGLGVPRRVQAGLLTVVVFMLFGFYRRETGSYNPHTDQTFFDSRKFTPGSEKVDRYLKGTFSAKFKNEKVKKNIIVIDIPNFETQMIGRYGYRWIYSTPFLSNMSQKVLFAHNLPEEGYTPRDGSGAVWNALCSMPVVPNPDHILTIAKKGDIPKLHCLGDFLDQLGYNVATYRAGKNDYRKLEPVLAKHGLRNFHEFPHDKELFEALNQTGLKELAGKNPFVLYITTIDTRPPIFAVCHYREELYNNHKDYKAVDCIDQYLEGFFAKLAELKLTPENTQIAVFGDGYRNDLDHHPIPLFKPQRRLFAMFPFAPRHYVTEPAALYDIAPTLLDLAEIEFSPKFPFGGNIKTAPNGLPGKNEYAQLYKGLE